MRQLPAVVYKVLALYTVYVRHFHHTALRSLSPFVWSAVQIHALGLFNSVLFSFLSNVLLVVS